MKKYSICLAAISIMIIMFAFTKFKGDKPQHYHAQEAFPKSAADAWLAIKHINEARDRARNRNNSILTNITGSNSALLNDNIMKEKEINCYPSGLLILIFHNGLSPKIRIGEY